MITNLFDLCLFRMNGGLLEVIVGSDVAEFTVQDDAFTLFPGSPSRGNANVDVPGILVFHNLSQTPASGDRHFVRICRSHRYSHAHENTISDQTHNTFSAYSLRAQH